MSRSPAAVLAAVASGGMVGASARYAVDSAWPGSGAVPWATLTINVSGCLLMGVLMAVVVARDPHPLLRPFLGVGVLGGYTTFSAYAVETVVLADDGRAGAALASLVLTPVLALVGVRVGLALGRAGRGRRA